ncbi:hypothetical protein BH24GEM2_BH24GEM2_06310 [soil metagenome]
MLLVLAPVDFFLTDRAGGHPRTPAAGVLHRPVRQVEVEGPDRSQTLPVVDPGHRDLRAHTACCGAALADRAQPLLPGIGNLTGEPEVLDARVMGLDVCPEQLAEEVGQRLQARVVQGGLTLAQVLHQKVTHRSVDDAVPVDQLLRGVLPTGAAPADQGRRLRLEYAQLAHDPAIGRAAHPRFGAGPVLGVEELEGIPEHDVGELATLGRQDQRATLGAL